MKLQAYPITLKEARTWVDNFHRHNKAPQGGLFAIAATYGDDQVGVVIVGRPIARMLQDGVTAEVTRCCVLPDSPKNTPSFLYGRAWRAWAAMGGLKIVTYTLQSESGASLRGAGFKIINQSPAHDGWVHSGNQRKWQPVYGQAKFRWERKME